jgi:hypothetical protein
VRSSRPGFELGGHLGLEQRQLHHRTELAIAFDGGQQVDQDPFEDLGQAAAGAGRILGDGARPGANASLQAVYSSALLPKCQ